MNQKEVALFVQKTGEGIKDYAMREYNNKAFNKSIMLAIVDNNKLAQIINTPTGKASMIQALRKAASNGLSLNPQEGKAALIPYGDKVQYQVMKDGMIELALETGKVEFITCDTVRSADQWDMSKTPEGDTYTFKPARRGRGEIDGVFAACKLKDGTTHVKYMDIDQVGEHRTKHSAKSSMPVEGYALKTVLKSLLRNLNIAPEVTAAVHNDDADEMMDVTPTEDVKGCSASTLSEELRVKQAETVEAVEVETVEPTPPEVEEKNNEDSIF